MKRAIVLIVLVVGWLASTAFAQTVANGPYYATPSWDQTLPASTRFIVLANMNQEAVLDRETGLVWERVPGDVRKSIIPPSGFGTDVAGNFCLGKNVGNRKGWRLPAAAELTSLFSLPDGHPFTVPAAEDGFWTATESFQSVFNIFVVLNGAIGLSTRALQRNVWCVRGGAGTDIQ